MRLSRGKVCGERLQCCYHGWTFDTQGRGEPGTPRLSTETQSYDTYEAHGWIWARRAGAGRAFPAFDTRGYKLIGDFLYSFNHPLELVVDNFTEAEHTGAVHLYFGYPIERLDEVECKVTSTDDSVTVRNYGPNKPMSLIHRLLMGIKKNYHLIDSWTTYFSPLYSVYNFDYDDPVSHEPGSLHQREVFFFIPESPTRTRVMVLLYIKYDIAILHICSWPFHRLLRHRFHYEVLLDQRLLEGLADRDPSIQGMKLSRFDKVLALNRERIERVYRQQSGNGEYGQSLQPEEDAVKEAAK